MHSSKIPIGKCLACGEANYIASSVTRVKPSAGDICICLYCGHMTVFNEDLTMHEPTEEETATALRNPEVRQHMEIQKKVKKESAH